MRHRKAGSKLNRNSSHRKAMFRNMVTSLFKHDRIKTTDAKAKILRGWADHIVTLAKRGDLHALRQALSIVREKAVVHKLFEEAGERFGSVGGGYTRIVKIGRRPGDAAPMSIIELVSPEGVKPKKKQRKKKAEQKPAVSASVEKADTATEEQKDDVAESAVTDAAAEGDAKSEPAEKSSEDASGDPEDAARGDAGEEEDSAPAGEPAQEK